MGSPPFELQPGETVLASSTSGKVESKLQMMPGHLWLTDRRLEFVGSKGLFTLLFGLIGRAVAKRSSVTLPLSSIARVERSSFGRNKNLLVLFDQSGTEHKFIVDKFDAVVEPLRQRTGASA